MTAFTIGAEDFLLDGRPHRILSGALHYFRVHPGHWADRIEKARLMGLNTIETYVAWNAHEPRRGEWGVTGGNDLGAFLDLVADAGMHAIVRPGPYICAEWHNGGLPVWLTGMPGIGLRRSEPQYLAAGRSAGAGGGRPGVLRVAVSGEPERLASRASPRGRGRSADFRAARAAERARRV